MDVVFAPGRAGRGVDTGESIDTIILEGEAARRVDQIGDGADIVVRIIAIGHRPDVGGVVRRAVAPMRARMPHSPPRYGEDRKPAM